MKNRTTQGAPSNHKLIPLDWPQIKNRTVPRLFFTRLELHTCVRLRAGAGAAGSPELADGPGSAIAGVFSAGSSMISSSSSSHSISEKAAISSFSDCPSRPQTNSVPASCRAIASTNISSRWFAGTIKCLQPFPCTVGRLSTDRAAFGIHLQSRIFMLPT